MKNFDKRLRVLINLSIVAVGLIVILLIGEIFGDFLRLFMSAFVAILLPFSIALFISYLVAPVFKLLEKRMKFKYRVINTVLVFIGIGALLFFFGRYAGTLIYEQGVAFIQNDWPRIIDYFDNLFSEGTSLHALYVWLTNYVDIGEGEKIRLDVIAIFQSLTTIILTIVLVPVFLYFILNDRKRIYESMISVLPKTWRKHAIELTKRANHVVEQYFNGRFMTMFVMAIFFTILMYILGFRERSILFGFMLGFFDIVPYVGPTIAIILPVLYAYAEPETLRFGEYAPYVILIATLTGQMIQNNVAQPLIMGRETRLHPLLILSAFVFFSYLFGIVGLILAIPITGMIKSTIDYLRELHADRIKLNKEELNKIREEKT